MLCIGVIIGGNGYIRNNISAIANLIQMENKLANTPENWLKDDFWRTPTWLVNNKLSEVTKSHKNYLQFKLRIRYTELESDFRSVYLNYHSKGIDEGASKLIVENLILARTILERGKVNFLQTSYLLDTVERYLIWIYPEHHIKEKAKRFAASIEIEHPEASKTILDLLSSEDLQISSLKSAYEQKLEEIHKENLANEISSGLQIKRLESLRIWSLSIFVISVILLPFIINYSEAIENAVESLNLKNVNSSDSDFAYKLLLALCFSIIGGIGGFISGLLQIKKSKVDLVEYQESMLLFQLEPIIGSLLGIFVFLILSWEILPGLKIDNIGSIMLIVFLSGFSERYFLNLLKIKEE